MSYGVGCRCGSDLTLLQLWCRLAATALIWPLTWELPYAAGAALKKKQKKKESISHEDEGMMVDMLAWMQVDQLEDGTDSPGKR